ncbi:MAG: hypothetical protein A2X94_15705 [Bdellovibrionales bacterium GWB1_55_8]|nr:MAG: hypothetical protein A2X94_15705 [Bdellovibrionales bacterium GWB1_55_8]
MKSFLKVLAGKISKTGAVAVVAAFANLSTAHAGQQIILSISNDVTKDVIRASVMTDKDGNLTGIEIGDRKYDLRALKSGAKLDYKKTALLTAKAPNLNPETGGVIDLICASGNRKSLRIQLKRDQNDRWSVFASGRPVSDLKLVIDLDWKMNPRGAKDIKLAQLDFDPNSLVAALQGPSNATAMINESFSKPEEALAFEPALERTASAMIAY